jgi:predicted glutamine amidotransferase
VSVPFRGKHRQDWPLGEFWDLTAVFRIKRYPIKSKNVIAHIRKATQGEVLLENCHPFKRECWGKYWVFAHNGDLKNFAPPLSGLYRPVGTTDSEYAFCYLMQKMRERFGEQMPPLAALSEFMREITTEIAQFGTFNMMLSNGDALFVHCSTHLHYIVRQYPFTSASLSDDDVSVDFSILTTPLDRVAVIVTEPLTSNENWISLKAWEFCVFVDGARFECM